MSWSHLTHNWCPPAWAQLSSVTTSIDVGVDFRPLIRSQYPMPICSERPVAIVSVFSEGMP